MLKNDFESQTFAIFEGAVPRFCRSDYDMIQSKNSYCQQIANSNKKNLTRYLSLLSQKNCRERYCRRRKQNFNIENLLFLALNLPHSCRCKAAFSKDLPAPSAKSNFTSSLSSFFASQKLKFISNYRQVNFVHNTIPNFYLFLSYGTYRLI